MISSTTITFLRTENTFVESTAYRWYAMKIKFGGKIGLLALSPENLLNNTFFSNEFLINVRYVTAMISFFEYPRKWNGY